MAEIDRLSVGKVLDKLRRPDSPKDQLAGADEKIEAAREELQRLRSQRRRLTPKTSILSSKT
jgi:hypothetical protein